MECLQAMHDSYGGPTFKLKTWANPGVGYGSGLFIPTFKLKTNMDSDPNKGPEHGRKMRSNHLKNIRMK